MFSSRPTTSNTANAELHREIQNTSKLDTIIDYIWCRLSEKCKKISTAFRIMDIENVKFKINSF
jgi:hypothetical protein